MKNLIKSSIIVWLSIISLSINAQKKGELPEYIATTDIEKAIHEELNQLVNSEDYKKIKAKCNETPEKIIFTIKVKAKRENITSKKYSKTLIEKVSFSESKRDNMKFKVKLQKLIEGYEFKFLMKDGINHRLSHTFVLE